MDTNDRSRALGPGSARRALELRLGALLEATPLLMRAGGPDTVHLTFNASDDTHPVWIENP